jgi:hypothetical protein
MGGCGGWLEVIAGLSSEAAGVRGAWWSHRTPARNTAAPRVAPSVIIGHPPDAPLPGDLVEVTGQRCGGSAEDQPATISRMSWAVSDGVLPTRTPAASRASCLAWAVPAEPDTIAPAWPMVLPSGAVNPAT